MDNNQLQRRIEALEKWQKEKQRQQISFPLDNQSIEILKKYFMHIVSVIKYPGGVGTNEFVTFLGQQGEVKDSTIGQNILFEVSPPSLVSYTVDISNDYLTTFQYSGNLKFFDNQKVVLYSDGIAPDPLIAGQGDIYYVINSDGYVFQLSLTEGGVAIDITDTGSGRQFITYSA